MTNNQSTGSMRQNAAWHSRAGISWLMSFGLSTLMFLFYLLCCHKRYATVDDGLITHVFMGYIGGEIPTFHVYLNALLTYPLHWLATAFPSVPWFTWMQLFFLWLASAVFLHSMIRTFTNHDHPLWLGLLMGLVFCCLFVMPYALSMTYTVTTALIGAAGIMQMLSIDYKRATDGAIIRGMMLSLVLIVLGYSLRQMTLLPVIAFCGLAFVYCTAEYFGFGKGAKRSLRPMVISLVITAVVLGSLVGLREVEIRAKGMQDHLLWQESRIEVMDYLGMPDLPEDVLEEIGWSQGHVKMARKWYFIGASTQDYEAIASYSLASTQPETTAQSLQNAGAKLQAFALSEPNTMRTACLLMTILALCIIGLLMQRNGTLWRWLCLLLLVLGGSAMVGYLLLSRFVLRGALTVYLPFAALLFGLIGAMLVLTAALLGEYALVNLPSQIKRPTLNLSFTEPDDVFCARDEYALAHPDTLFLCDHNLVKDYRLFPAAQDGVPENLLIWGDWNYGSGEYREMLASFGIEMDEIDASIFLRDNVRFLSDTGEPSLDLPLAYIQEECGEGIGYHLEEEYISLYAFCIK